MKKIIWLMLSATLLLATACTTGLKQDQSSTTGDSGSAVVTPQPSPSPLVFSGPLEWKQPEWDEHLAEAIELNWGELYKVTDMNKFCSNYYSLSDQGKKNAWGYLFVSMSKFESSWNPKTRFKEPAPLNVWSEGLFQMTVGEKGLTKENILNPYHNIHAAAAMMATLVKRYGIVQVPRGKSYWSVITPGNKYQKIDPISSMVSKAKGCM